MTKLGSYLENSLMQRPNSWSAARRLEQVYKHAPPGDRKPLEITENDIILGFKDEVCSRDNVQLLKINRISDSGERYNLTMAFLGINGTQKTVTAKTVFLDNLYARQDELLFIYNPKDDWAFIEDAYDEHEALIDPINKELGMERRGYHRITVSPQFMHKKADIEFKISYLDVMEIYVNDPEEALRLTVEVLGIDRNSQDAIDVLRVVMTDRLSSFVELRDAIAKFGLKKDSKKKQSDDEKAQGPSAVVAGKKTLLNKLFYAQKHGVITTKAVIGIDVVALLLEHKIVVYQGKIRTETKGNYIDLQFNGCLKIVMTKIIQDMQAWYQRHERTARLKGQKLCMVFDELSELAPNNEDVSTTVYMRNIPAKCRSAGIDFGGLTQEYSTVDPVLFEQIKYRFSSRLTAGNATLFRRGNMQEEDIEWLKNMRLKVHTSVGMDMAEWFVETPEKEIIQYVPIWTQSKHTKIKA